MSHYSKGRGRFGSTPYFMISADGPGAAHVYGPSLALIGYVWRDPHRPSRWVRWHTSDRRWLENPEGRRAAAGHDAAYCARSRWEAAHLLAITESTYGTAYDGIR